MGRLSPVWYKVSDLRIVSGSRCRVFDDTGRSYLDFTSGIAVTSTGHAHPAVVKAVSEQAARIMHAQVNCYSHDLLQPLVDALDKVTPSGIDTFFFSNSGAEATESAVKLAKAATGRTNIIVFDGSFHGRTHLAMAMTASKNVYRANYQPLPAGVFVAPFAQDRSQAASALSALERVLDTQTAPSETAAVVLELVQGEGGYRAADYRFVQDVLHLCREHGILFVADEVQSGFGRTGRMFAFEHYNIVPDIIVMAKGIASGMPLSAVGASWDIMSRWPVGSHGGTFGGNPVSCAAALATLEVLEKEGLVKNALDRGSQLRLGLQRIVSSHRSDDGFSVSGLGMMLGLVCPSSEIADALLVSCRDKGLLLMTAGSGKVLRFMPPLVVSSEEMSEALAVMDRAMGDVIYNKKILSD